MILVIWSDIYCKFVYIWSRVTSRKHYIKIDRISNYNCVILPIDMSSVLPMPSPHTPAYILFRLDTSFPHFICNTHYNSQWLQKTQAFTTPPNPGPTKSILYFRIFIFASGQIPSLASWSMRRVSSVLDKVTLTCRSVYH